MKYKDGMTKDFRIDIKDREIIGFNGILDYTSGIIQNIYFRVINTIWKIFSSSRIRLEIKRIGYINKKKIKKTSIIGRIRK